MSKEKIAIVTDSTAYIPAELIEKYQIHVVPLSVIIDGVAYKEEVELSTADFYKKVKESTNFPTSSQPAPGDFITLFETLKQEGYNKVLTIHLTSGISGTYQNAVTAGNSVDGIEVIGIDSGIACMAQGSIVLSAAQMVAEGKNVSEILAHIEAIQNTMDAYFMVDDLNTLQRGGRLTGAQAIIGSLLQIKPILHFQDKQIVLFEKVRTQKKALKRIEEVLQEAVQKKEAEQAYVIHGNAPEKGQKWLDELQSMFPEVEFHLSYFGPVIGTHLGEGALGLTWSIK
ncbi:MULTISPECIES: DegV family protein [unclassified Listeria]|uniref:DegV family protein n=1 Tax=unclassified Listeria TaxID=2642072 RepID=UPI000B58DC4B|nr:MULTISPECIES: DegV family protein [unclassified Listeria]